MASFDFPVSPNDNDTYSLNGITYKFVAAKQRWEIVPNPHNFETTAQLDLRDTANRSRSNHTGTQTASTISDFDTEVSNNIDVAANTAARHIPEESLIIYLYPLDATIAATTKAAIIPYLPYNLEVSELILEVDLAPTGSNIQVDVNVDGTSLFASKQDVISIDATETSSTTATYAYAINTTTFPNSRIPKGSTVTVDIDQVGSTIAGRNLVLVINGVRY